MTNKIRIKAGISRTARRNQAKPTIVNIDSRLIRKAENEEYLESQNVRAFLSAIAWAEGGDYHAKAGAWKDPKKWRFTNESTHPGAGLSGSTAAGRYQITIATWRDHGVKGMGISDFSPHTQDLIAVSILKRAGAVQPLLVNDFKNAMEKASGPWAALEKGPEQGNRHPPQPFKKYEDIREKYIEFGGRDGR